MAAAFGGSRLLAFALTVVLTTTLAQADHDPDFDYEPPAPGSYVLPVIRPAADGTLLDSTGKSVRLDELTHGRITVLSFIYTRCAAPKACPYATGVLNQL